MITKISALLQTCLSHLAHLSPQQWFIGLILAMVVGAVCLRGFGSRSAY